MKPYDCLLCLNGLMPAGIDPFFGPVYRACPHCHTTCLGCDGLGMFPASRGDTLEATFGVLYHLSYDVQLCDRCTGIVHVWPPTPASNTTQDDLADTVHRVENLLRQLVDTYYDGCKQYESAPQADSSQRVYWRTHLAAIAEIGEKLADALGLATPDWEYLRDLAKPDPWAQR